MALMTRDPNDLNGDGSGKIKSTEDELVILDADGNELHFSTIITREKQEEDPGD